MRNVRIDIFIKGRNKLLLLLTAILLWSCVVASVTTRASADEIKHNVSSMELTDKDQVIQRVAELNLLPEENVFITVTNQIAQTGSWEISYDSGDLDAERQSKHSGFIKLSASTGELLYYYYQLKLSNGACGNPCEYDNPMVSLDEAMESATAYFHDLNLNLDTDWKRDDYAFPEGIRYRSGPSHLISFDRMHENIRYPSNRIAFYVNGWTGEVYQYTIRWEKVSFVKPDDLISYDEAGQIFFNAIKPQLNWSANPRNPEELKLVYFSRGPHMIDASGNFAQESTAEPITDPIDIIPQYPATFAKHRIAALYELELHYIDTEEGLAEPFYQLRIKQGVPLYYYEPHPYIGAEDGKWYNFLHETIEIPSASEWLIDHIAPPGQVNYQAAVVWNNELLKLENEPIIQDNFTLVPLRELLEKLDVSMTWDPVNRKVTASNNGTRLELMIDSDTAFINGNMQLLSTPARIVNDLTYIPARIVLETFGAKVDWNADSRLIIVQTDHSLPELTSSQLDLLRLHAQLNWEENNWKP